MREERESSLESRVLPEVKERKGRMQIKLIKGANTCAACAAMLILPVLLLPVLLLSAASAACCC
jgi:secreted protein with Ig-like and vWFA domain